jgi:hypothetical protein
MEILRQLQRWAPSVWTRMFVAIGGGGDFRRGELHQKRCGLKSR